MNEYMIMYILVITSSWTKSANIGTGPLNEIQSTNCTLGSNCLLGRKNRDSKPLNYNRILKQYMKEIEYSDGSKGHMLMNECMIIHIFWTLFPAGLKVQIFEQAH